jgi:HSP20 family protein
MSEMVRWEPAREMSLREAMNRLFEESFLRPAMGFAPEGAAAALPVDVYETDEGIVVKAAVPGVKPEEIEVTVTGDLLSIKGEFKSEERIDQTKYLRHERRYGSFCRQIGLPAGLKVDGARASFENGILTLELPKVESARARTIKVTAG